MAEPKVIFGHAAEPTTVHLCPVCRGRGTVPAGFYGPPMGTSAAELQCRACGGRGYLHLLTVTINGGQRPSSIERLKKLRDMCNDWKVVFPDGRKVSIIVGLSDIIDELES